jgi:tRNA threonylcarbamoyladenosine biosynthesis protein TsaE
VSVHKAGLSVSCVVSSSPEETIAIAEGMAGLLRKGSVLALRGPLGAGKTCFVKGIARFLAVEEEITSPTYTIVSEYAGKLNGQDLPFYHIDAYRLQGDDDFYALGGEEYLFGEGVSVVEWSERIPNSLPAEAWIIDIEITGDNRRNIRVSGGIPS